MTDFTPFFRIRVEAHGYSVFALYPDGHREYIDHFATKRAAQAEVRRLTARERFPMRKPNK